MMNGHEGSSIAADKYKRDYYKDSYELIEFIEKSPSPYHVIDNIRSMLSDIGMQELSEKDKWKLKAGQGYYVLRGASSIIAFTMPEYKYKAYNIVASHSDSPSLR